MTKKGETQTKVRGRAKAHGAEPTIADAIRILKQAGWFEHDIARVMGINTGTVWWALRPNRRADKCRLYRRERKDAFEAQRCTKKLLTQAATNGTSPP